MKASNIGSFSLSVLLFASVFVIVNSTSYSEATEQEGLENSYTGITALASSDSGEVVAASGSNRFVVWFQANAANTSHDIFFRRSTDNGATWKPSVNLSNNPGFSSYIPRIAVSGSNVYVVWFDDTPGNFDILFRRSTDNGATWKPTVNLSNNPGRSQVPNIAVSGSNIYVGWSQFNADETLSDSFFRRSTDNGATWKPVKNLSSNGHSLASQIAMSGSSLYVFYIDHTDSSQELFLRRSTDNGATWTLAMPTGIPSGLAAVSGSDVYLVWVAGRFDLDQSDVFFKRSTDYGATWKAVKNLSNNLSSFLPDIAASGSNVYVVWIDNTGTDFRRSTDNGATWKAVKNLSSPGFTPNIAVSGPNVYVVSYGGASIFFSRSTDNGATWKAVVNLSNNAQSSYYPPQIALSGPNVYVMWIDDITSSNDDILFKRSTDNGATWKAVVNLSNNPGPSQAPQIGV